MKSVTIFNNRKGVKQTFPSMAEAARTLDVSISEISRAARTGQWVFSKGLEVRVRTT